jgi:hypothetical protein
MLVSPVSAATWAGLGVAATLVCAFVAQRLGFLQVTLMRQAHTLNVAKAAPRIGCEVTVGLVQILPQIFDPHLVVNIKIYNEGELPAESINGQWKLLPPDPDRKRVLPIQRDFLGQCENYTQTYQVNESSEWNRQGVIFDVEVRVFLRGSP